MIHNSGVPICEFDRQSGEAERTSELREAAAALAAAIACEKVTFLFAFVHWQTSIPNHCKPIVYDSIPHSGWISVRFIDTEMRPMVFATFSHSLSFYFSSDLYLLKQFFGSILFCGKRIKALNRNDYRWNTIALNAMRIFGNSKTLKLILKTEKPYH